MAAPVANEPEAAAERELDLSRTGRVGNAAPGVLIPPPRASRGKVCGISYKRAFISRRRSTSSGSTVSSVLHGFRRPPPLGALLSAPLFQIPAKKPPTRAARTFAAEAATRLVKRFRQSPPAQRLPLKESQTGLLTSVLPTSAPSRIPVALRFVAVTVAGPLRFRT